MSALQPFAPERVPLAGTCLIEAGAGTGKTYAIVSLYLRLLLERRLDVSQILVVTYTVAATGELRDRIRARLVALAAALGSPDEPEHDAALVRSRRAAGDLTADRERVLDAVRGFDRAAVFTIHGFCQRVLSEHAFESGSAFDSELVSDQSALLEEVAGDFLVRELHAAPAIPVALVAGDLYERLLELAERVASRRDVVVHPARPSVPDLAALETRWREAHATAAADWRARRDEIIDLLADAAERKLLDGRRYQPARIRERWPVELDAALALSGPGVEAAFAAFERFTVSGLQASRSARASAPPPADPFFEHCQELLEVDRALGRGCEDWRTALEHDFVDYARAELAARKQERGVLFFDDLLDQLREALAGEGGGRLVRAVRRRHPVALIDEFQDTDRVQYAIFRTIWDDDGREVGPRDAAPALFLIGDPKQAIYAFRGADVFTYLEAAGRAQARYGLATNYRSDPGLVEALNAAFSGAEAPFADDAIHYDPVTARAGATDVLAGGLTSGLRVLLASPDGSGASVALRREQLVRDVAAEVARTLVSGATIEGKPVEAGDVAVLTRTNAQARKLQAALRRHGVASVLLSEESVFATDEASELERVMRAMAEPDQPARLRAALATTLLSSSADDLQPLLDDDSATAADAWEAWGARFRRARRRWVERGFVQALRLLWIEGGVGPRLLARTDGERRVTNLLHLAELLQREAVEGRLGPLALVYWFGHRRAEARAARKWVAEDAQLRLESDDLAVQLVTVHRSKGLEYPITFCPFLWEGQLVQRNDRFPRFHDPETGALALDLVRARPSFRLAEQEAFAESLRLLYVAVTRARHHCSVVFGVFDSKVGTSPLGQLLWPAPLVGGDPPAAGRFDGVPPSELEASLAPLSERASGHLAVGDLAPAGRVPAPIVPFGEAGAAGGALRHRVARRVVASRWRVSSFSGLVASAPERDAGRLEAPEVEEGRDYDASSQEAAAAGAADRAASEQRAPVRLADFPAGAGPGILIHEIFENLDFRSAGAGRVGAGGLVERTRASLLGHGMAASLAEPLAEAIREVLATPLEPGDPASRLQELGLDDRIDEMPFMLPSGSAALPVTPARLAEVFAAHGRRELSRRYAARARTLAFPALEGHLRGFVDLVFRRGERWYVVDYKSNHLGSFASDYEGPALETSMLEHDYVLQYHLYVVALHRHLQLRLPDYDYDRHLGGAYYLFVRGMSPRHPPGCGVLHDLPPRALVEALSRLLGEERA